MKSIWQSFITGTYSINCKGLEPIVGLGACGLDIAMLWGRVAVDLSVAIGTRGSGLLVGGSVDVGRSVPHGCHCSVVIVVNDGDDILLEGHSCNREDQELLFIFHCFLSFVVKYSKLNSKY